MSTKNEKDCRALTDVLMNELEKKGGFEEFVNFVRKNKELALCFRGNASPEMVNIYYNNHTVWKLDITQDKKLRVRISFNHARYSEDWKENYETLCNKYNFKKKKLDNKSKEIDIGELTAISDYFDKSFVEGTFSIMKPLIEDFFNKDLKFDYFKNKKVQHRDYLEKIRQQELYLKFDNLKDGLFIYDLEFAQKTTKNTNKSNNQPDMLGIRYKNGKPEKLVFVEVKCKKSAMNNDSSGLIKHIKGMEEYKKDKNAIKNRIIEAGKILEQYQKLNLRNIKQASEIPTNIPIEIRVILTDEAAKYFVRNKNYFEKIKNADKKNLSAILRAKGYEIEYISDNYIEIYQ